MIIFDFSKITLNIIHFNTIKDSNTINNFIQNIDFCRRIGCTNIAREGLPCCSRGCRIHVPNCSFIDKRGFNCAYAVEQRIRKLYNILL